MQNARALLAVEKIYEKNKDMEAEKKSKRRGRPPGSKNKKKMKKTGAKRAAGSVPKDQSHEKTIRLLIKMPASVEVRARLIMAVFDVG